MDTQRIKLEFTKRITHGALALFIATFSFPAVIHAEGETTSEATETTQTAPPPTEPTPTTDTPTTPTTTTEAPANPSTQGPQSPTGAEGDGYTYNETTGLWENSKYTWDPVTKQTSPKTTPTYSYNPETGHWDTTEWIYDASSGTYVPNIISTLTPPEGATLDTAQGTPPANDGQGGITGGAASQTSSNNPSALTASAQSNPTNTEVNGNSSSTGIFDLFYNAFISNNLTSSAISGDALVSMNTLAGNALSGDATAIATVFNLLQSVWSLGLTGNALSVFTQNIFGNVLGDLWLQPTANTAQSSPSSDVTVNASQDAAIHNTINLEATSGDAAVTNNTTAGNATSGAATVIANIINAINSSIVSGNSFVGMLNIYGSLDGDILLPQDLIGTLLASNAIGALDTSQISNTSVLGEFNNTLSTTNNVNASSTSGDATVSQNTSAGSATTGDAETNITVLNLTGREVIGKNALLVFVNVLGTWVGMIVDAPTGTTSAAFGSGITEDNSLAVTQTNNQAIVNDINAHATSGNALVSRNTTAGNATSGNAMTAVNILNMNSSQLALSDWFGVLFINVFGSWNGSFGIDTLAGTLPTLSSTQSTSGPSVSPQLPQLSANAVKAFKFTPNGNGTHSLESSEDGVAALQEAQVLAAEATPQETQGQNSSSQRSPTTDRKKTSSSGDWVMTAITLSLGLSLLGTERFMSRRSARATT